MCDCRYHRGHYIGAAICIGGLTVLVASDSSSSTGGSAPVWGDALVVVGATMYAVSNVAQECVLGNVSVVELIAMIGCFGALFSGIQAVILEHHAWTQLHWQAADVVPLLGFAAALYCFYSLVPLVLLWGGATVLNLSLLSSDLWAGLARWMLFGGFGGTALYFISSVAMVAAGIAVYAFSGDVKAVDAAGQTGSSHQARYKGYHRLTLTPEAMESYVLAQEEDRMGNGDGAGGGGGGDDAGVVAVGSSSAAAAAGAATAARVQPLHKHSTLVPTE